MDNFTKLIKESLLNNFLNESMALLKDLENHTDFDTLITSLEDSLGIKMERTLRSGTYNGREGYYLRTPDVGAWTENAKGSITRALDKANAKAQDYTFEFENVSDFEEEPGERTWDAAIEFYADKEEEEEMWTDPAGGTHYGDDDDPASDYMEESIDREFHSTKVTLGSRLSHEEQLKLAYESANKARQTGDIRGYEWALAIIDDLEFKIDKFVDEELETPNELADESKQDTSASGAYESKEFDFKKMIKEAIITQLIKTK